MNPTDQPENVLDPQDLFAFLAKHDEYPVSGLKLAEAARSEDAAPELAEFFEALPGTLESESEIVSHAVKPYEAPYNATLDVSGGEPTEPYVAPDDATLLIDDIVPEKPL
ncbi:MAG: hypothetical protein K0S68_1044 [Candidatus Saccharibacteria bacterium]|jgi:hypothetical protein|nr:hypothetical protein [Candidatus Saccharibacteria bacterium]